MKQVLTLIIFVLLVIQPASGQQAPNTENIKNQMSKLAFMLGDWEGSGWHIGPDRQKSEFMQTEDIKFELDGTILVIKGLGKTEGEVIHDAMAIVSYDSVTESYDFRSYLSDGRAGDFEAEVDGNKFIWTLLGKIRYHIEINEKGEWHETGEYLVNDIWFQFFEMNLKKTDQ